MATSIYASVCGDRMDTYEELDFVVPLVAPTCLGDLAWRFFSARRSRQQIESATLTQDELRFAAPIIIVGRERYGEIAQRLAASVLDQCREADALARVRQPRLRRDAANMRGILSR